MPGRLVICAGALACALTLCAAGAGGAGAAPAEGVFKGRTAQKRGIVVAVRGDRVRVLRFVVRLGCGEDRNLVLKESGFRPMRVGARNRFADVQLGRTDVVRFRGRVFPRAVRGRVRVSGRLYGNKGPRCFSPWVGFAARLARR